MATTAQDIRDALLNTNREFQQLAREHSRCESQLEQLQTQPYLNSEDLALEVMLKKVKLRLKDQMERLIIQHQSRMHPH